jgi:penicillin-binding protein 1A
VDTWVTGGLQFANGAAYSYVVVVGSGTTAEPWSRSLHAAQLGVPLVNALLLDLEQHAKKAPAMALLPPTATPVATPARAEKLTTKTEPKFTTGQLMQDQQARSN